MVSDSDKQPQYGEDADRVRELFADGKPHSPKEATKVSEYGYAHIKALFYRGVLLRTRDQLNYTYVETHGKKAKWCRVPVNKIFIEQKPPEPKVKALIPMYKPLEVSKCEKCGKVIAEPKERIRILKV